MKNLRKINKTQALTIIALVIVFILLFPIPMPRSREELYMTTETYYDELPEECMHCMFINVPYAVNETVSIPYQVIKYMQWQVTWRTLTPDRQWGAIVGNQTFTSTFWFNWGNRTVYASYNDTIGFTAEASFYQETYGIYKFTLGSDDGSRLYINETLLIDLWWNHNYMESTTELEIEPGWHTLTIDYYEWTNDACIYFNVDKGDVFTWEETQYLIIQIPRIYYSKVAIPRLQIRRVQKERITVANRTVTETVYSSLLEYLMKGGKP